MTSRPIKNKETGFFDGTRPPVPGKEDDDQGADFQTIKPISTISDFRLSKSSHSRSLSFDNCQPDIQSYNSSHHKPSNYRTKAEKLQKLETLRSIIDLSVRENCVGRNFDEPPLPAQFSNPKASFSSYENRPAYTDSVSCCDGLCCSLPKSSSPLTCLRWTEGLQHLLEDSDGTELFRNFLEGEIPHSSKILDFLFACRGLQLVEAEKVVGVVRLIYKRFLLKSGTGLQLDDELRKRIARRIKKINENGSFTSTSNDGIVEKCHPSEVPPIKNIFDEACREAESFLEREMYPSFLKSEGFLEYFQKESEVIFKGGGTKMKGGDKNDTDSIRENIECARGCSDISKNGENYNCTEIKENDDGDDDDIGGGCEERRRPPSSPKLDIHEEKELEMDFPTDVRVTTGNTNSESVSVLQLSSLSLLATRKQRQSQMDCSSVKSSSSTSSSSSAFVGKLSNPYHVSYAPGSALDSELQSLSSDALTEDTLSFTDSSLDGRIDIYKNRPLTMAAYKKHIRYVRNFAAKNHEANFPARFIPRTDRVPANCNIASSDPETFASMLIEKLQIVKEKQEKMERLMKVMQGLQQSEKPKHGFDQSQQRHGNNHHHIYQQQQRISHKSKLPQQLHINNNRSELLGSEAYNLSDEDGENAQSILDEHISQLWSSFGNSPNHFTPIPGFATPDGKAGRSCSAALTASNYHNNSSGHCSYIANNTRSFNRSNDLVKSGQSIGHHKPSNIGNAFCNLDKSDSGEVATSVLQTVGVVCRFSDCSKVHQQMDSSSNHHHHHHSHQRTQPSENVPLSFAQPLTSQQMISSSGYRSAFVNPGQISTKTSFLAGSVVGNFDCHSNLCSGLNKGKQQQYPIEQHRINCVAGCCSISHEAKVIFHQGQSAFSKKSSASHQRQTVQCSSYHACNLTNGNTTSNDKVLSWMRKHEKKNKAARHDEFIHPTNRKISTFDNNENSAKQPSTNFVKDQVHRSKSLDRNRILSTNKISSIAPLSLIGPLTSNECKVTRGSPQNISQNMKQETIQPLIHFGREASSSGTTVNPLLQSESTRRSRAVAASTVTHLQTNLPQQSNNHREILHTSATISANQSFTSNTSQNSMLCMKSNRLCGYTVVGYYIQNEPIPYRITVPGNSITLGQLKQAISKKENYRFFFKKLCSDFDDSEVVHEEIRSDDEVLPLWDGKVVCRIEKIE